MSSKLSALTALLGADVADTDLLYIADVSAAASKSITIAELAIKYAGNFASTSHTHTFASLTSKPTTIAGYGITDAFTQTTADGLYSAIGHTHTFASLTSKPTTLAGYGITDAAASTHSHAASDITSGVLAAARIATGTPDGTKFLRDDQVWTAVTATDATKLPLAGGTMTGTITSTIGTITASTPALNITQTWNSSGVTFKGILLNVTNTASAAASRIVDFQNGGTSAFSIDTSNKVTIPSATLTFVNLLASSGGYLDVGGGSSATSKVYADNTSLGLAAGINIKWGASNAQASYDTGIGRTSAGLVEINNGTTGTYRDLKLRDIYINGATYLARTTAALTDSAGANTATMTNAPVSGNPTKWIAIDDNGTSRKIPAW